MTKDIPPQMLYTLHGDLYYSKYNQGRLIFALALCSYVTNNTMEVQCTTKQKMPSLESSNSIYPSFYKGILHGVESL